MWRQPCRLQCSYLPAIRPAATADLVFVYALPALTSRDQKLLWRFALLALFRAPESWLRSENPAHRERVSAREEDRRRPRARRFAKRERKRDVTSITSATATQTDQAA